LSVEKRKGKDDGNDDYDYDDYDNGTGRQQPQPVDHLDSRETKQPVTGGAVAAADPWHAWKSDYAIYYYYYNY
jgi:hypothetical protein